jgi:carbonic anhydrase
MLGGHARAAAPAKPSVSPDEALKRLMDGHAVYRANQASFGNYGVDRAKRALGQSPIAAILSCSDSRVPPELIFNQGPGNTFVVRVAGNVENADGLASLEYGVKFLGIPLIMVMGHSGCGAVDAAIKVYHDRAVLPGHLPGLAELIIPAVQAAEATHPSDLLAASVTENVRRTVRTIAATEPILAPAIRDGSVKVVGSVYDIATGRVTLV